MQLRSFFSTVPAAMSLCAGLLFAVLFAHPAHAESLSHGRFKNVQIFKPTGPVKQVALFLSGDGGWDKGMTQMATEVANDGSMVVGIDTRKFFAELEEDGGSCVFPDGDLE